MASETISELLFLRNEALFFVHLGTSSGVLAEIAEDEFTIILAPFRESAGDWIFTVQEVRGE